MDSGVKGVVYTNLAYVTLAPEGYDCNCNTAASKMSFKCSLDGKACKCVRVTGVCLERSELAGAVLSLGNAFKMSCTIPGGGIQYMPQF